MMLTLEQRIERLEAIIGPPPFSPLHAITLESVRTTSGGGGGTDLEAGTGIVITGNVISHRAGNSGDLHSNYTEWAAPEQVTAKWTFQEGLSISAGKYLTFGADVNLSRIGADVLGLGMGDTFRSTDFLSGVRGWDIAADGSAEFLNVFVRGELHATVFVKDLIEAHAGTMVVAKSAGVLAQDATVLATSYYIYVNDPPGGGLLFSASDIVTLKTNTPVGVYQAWMTVASPTDMGDGTQRYTCTLQSGTAGITYSAGSPAIDYGQSGQGYLLMSADLNYTPYYDVRTHAGAPWTTETSKLRLGNLAGITSPSFGALTGYGLWCDRVYLEGDGNIAGSLIVDGSITTDKLAARSVTADKLLVGDMLFNAADGAILLNSTCEITATEWYTTRHALVMITGSFQSISGRWPGGWALVVNPAATNRCQEPRFEAALNDWSANGGVITRETTPAALYGSYVLKAVTGAGVTQGSQYLCTAETTASTKYTFSVWLRGNVGGESVRLWFWDATGGYQYSDVFTLKLTWSRYSVTKTFDTGVARYVGVGNAVAAVQTWYHDGAQLETTPYSYATMYLDGSMGSGFAWTGTADLSTSTRTATDVILDSLTAALSRDTMSFRTMVRMPYDADDTSWPVPDDYAPIYDSCGTTYADSISLYYRPSLDKFDLFINGASVCLSATEEVFKAGDWMDLVVTVDFVNDEYALYVNGQLHELDTGHTLSAPALTRWSLGLYAASAVNQVGFAFSEFALFESVLSAIDVAQMFNLERALVDTVGTDVPGVYILDGRFRIASSSSGSRIDISPTEIAGYNSGTKQFYLRSLDGQAMAGGGAVILNQYGFEVHTTGEANIYSKWYNSDITVYTSAFGFANLAKTDPDGATYGAMNFGVRHDANNQSGIVAHMGEVDVVIEKAAAWRYVLECLFEKVRVEGVPFRLAQLAADPTTDLEDGMMYYNTTTGWIRYRSGGAWFNL